jgi:hypothetical protein
MQTEALPFGSVGRTADPSETGVVPRLVSQHHCAGTSIANIIMLVAGRKTFRDEQRAFGPARPFAAVGSGDLA